MQNNLTCLIFDFDGVIADTDRMRYKLLQKLLEPFEVILSDDFNLNNLIGISTEAFLIQYNTKLTQSQIAEIIRKRHELYFNNLKEYCIPIEGMCDFFKRNSRNYDFAIVTTNSKKNIVLQLKHLDIFRYFKWIIGREICEGVDMRKTYKPVKNIISTNVKNCIVIEDSDVGVKAAREENYYCIRLDIQNRFEKNLENQKVSNYDALEKCIEKFANRLNKI
jgi:beta-phosphoglucomutase-like phosphatase (HAD superfamily)